MFGCRVRVYDLLGKIGKKRKEKEKNRGEKIEERKGRAYTGFDWLFQLVKR